MPQPSGQFSAASGDRGHVHGVTRGCGPGPGGAAVWAWDIHAPVEGPGQVCRDPTCCPAAGDRGRGGHVSAAAPGGRPGLPGRHRWAMGVVRAGAMEHRCRCGPGRPGAVGGGRGLARRAWCAAADLTVPSWADDPGRGGTRPRREVCVTGAAVRPVRRLTLRAVVTVGPACPGSARAVLGVPRRSRRSRGTRQRPARRSGLSVYRGNSGFRGNFWLLRFSST